MAKAILSAVGAALGTAVAGPVGTFFGGKKGAEMGEGIREGRRQEDSAKKTEAMLYANAKQAQKDAETVAEGAKTRDQKKARQRQGQLASGGRSSTILTSPLGVTGEESKGTKTLLGS